MARAPFAVSSALALAFAAFANSATAQDAPTSPPAAAGAGSSPVQVEHAPPPAEPAPAPLPPIAAPPTVIAPPVAAPRAVAHEVRPYQLVAWVGRDFGNSRMVTVYFTDGSTETMNANDGYIVGGGARFLRFFEGRLETQATLGYKRASIRGGNGSIVSQSVLVELLQGWSFGIPRVAGGLSLQLAHNLNGTGAASGFDVPFKHSLGMVLQLTFGWSPWEDQRWQLEVGGRFTWAALRVDDARQATTKANAFGIVLGAAY